MSANAAPMPASASHSPRPRTPGMSTTYPPPGMATISRLTVVWRPLPSPSRTVPVSCTSSPTSMLTRLDFPTPDFPTSTVVVPGAMRARTASTLSVLPSDTTNVRTSGPASVRTRSATCSTCSSLSARSAFVSTTVTAAPVSYASTSSRSRRRRFTSASGWAKMTRSKFAASTWGTARSVGSLRTKARSRGQMDSIMPLSWPSGAFTSTKSPMTARTFSPLTRAVACSQRTRRPSSHRTSGYPRSSFTTCALCKLSSL